MKTVDPVTEILINTGDFASWDLYTLTLFGGALLRYAAAPFDISDGTDTWSAAGVRVMAEAGQAHWKVGLDVDSWVVAFLPREPDQDGVFSDFIADVPFLEAVQAGALDNADVEISRAYFAAPPAPNTIPPTGALCVGDPLVIFVGTIAEVDTTHMAATVTIRDHRYLLDRMTPPHVYQAGCRHTLFDVGCTLTAATFATAGVVGAASTRNVIVPNPQLMNPAGSGTYKLGRIVITSGDNDTWQATISDWDGDQLMLVSPLPFDPVAGQTFTVYPGCSKSQAACALFANSLNFGGQPFIPSAETAV